MPLDLPLTEQLLATMQFEALFREKLGWDAVPKPPLLPLMVDGEELVLLGVAKKRGFRVWACYPDAHDRMPTAPMRAYVAARAAAESRQCFVVFLAAEGRQQLWCPPTRAPSPSFHMSGHHLFLPGLTSGFRHLLSKLAFSPTDEDSLTLPVVADRVRHAFRDDRRTYLRKHDERLAAAEDEAQLPPAPGRHEEFSTPEFQSYLAEYSRVPLLTAAEERHLGQLVAEGSADERVAAWRQFVLANLRLVVYLARRYRNRGVDLLDLIQEGNAGLMAAAWKFDYLRGTRFATYAIWWIRQAIIKAIADHSRTIRLPAAMGDSVARVQRASAELAACSGSTPTAGMLAEELRARYPDGHLGEYTPARVLEILAVPQSTVHLETVPGPLTEWVRDEPQIASLDLPLDFPSGDPAPERHALASSRTRVIQAALNSLASRERRILALRSGLIGDHPSTLQEIANDVGRTRERVRQIEQKALRKLRHPLLAKPLWEVADVDLPRLGADRVRLLPGWNRFPRGSIWWQWPDDPDTLTAAAAPALSWRTRVVAAPQVEPVADSSPQANGQDTTPAAIDSTTAAALDAELRRLRAEGFDVEDSRGGNGPLWVHDPTQQLAPLMHDLRRLGIPFRFALHRHRHTWGWCTQ